MKYNANLIPRYYIQRQTSETNYHQAPPQNLADNISKKERKL